MNRLKDIAGGALLMAATWLTIHAVLLGHIWAFLAMCAFGWPLTIAIVEQVNLND